MYLRFIQPERNRKKTIDAQELKRLASEGKTRREISDAMRRPYGRFWMLVKDSVSLTEAFNEGVAIAEQRKNANRND